MAGPRRRPSGEAGLPGSQLVTSELDRPPSNRLQADKEVVEALNKLVSRHGRWGFWKCFHWLRQQGHPWNHKRVWRVYKSMGLNLPRRTKRRLPARVKQPLEAPAVAGRQWSMDFMHDTLYHGKRFRTLNIIDEGVREALAMRSTPPCRQPG